MKTLKFKSNIKCSACVEKVTPFLDGKEGIDNWDVDITKPEKTLTVESESLEAEDIQKVIERAGYRAEPLS